MEARIAYDAARGSKARIEGPTLAQAKRMAARRLELLKREQEALSAGDDDTAFNLGCDAFDLEVDLISYGFDSTTGKRSA